VSSSFIIIIIIVVVVVVIIIIIIIIGRGEKSVQGLGGKARRKETTWKTKA
jgi:preprotein translocase subunit SecG